MILRISRLAVVSIIIASLGLLSVLNDKVMAGVPDWNAGYIISDQVFTDTSRMSVSQIQTFLNSKVPNCDTYGQALSEFGGPDTNGDGKVQRWEWGQANYSQTVFPCLKDVRVADGRSAAQVIYDVSQQYGINPQVFIVLLQKEQGLVTDTWPLNRQYRAATGYGCPDTAECNSQYYWLDNQIEWSGKMYRAIMDNSPSWYTPYEVGDNFIKYNPNSSCGGSNVYIQNRATQALYNYTPYQPNQATLDAGWGTAYCGAYGNLRFFQYFTSWFGSTRGGDIMSYDLVLDSPFTVSPNNPRPGETVTVSYTVRNISQNTISWDNNILQCRNEGFNCDSSMGTASSLASGATRSFSHNITTNSAGYLVFVPFYRSQGLWYRYAPYTNGANSLTMGVPNLRATSTLNSHPTTPNIGETMRYQFTVTNSDKKPITIDNTILQCRYELSTNCDSSMGGSETIAAYASKTYTYTIPASATGDYVIVPYYKFNGVWYKYANLDTPHQVYVTGLQATVDISSNPSSPIPLEPFSTSTTITNIGKNATTVSHYITQCRMNISTNCDSPNGPSFTLAPGESRVISDSFKQKMGNYRFISYYNISNEWHVFADNTPLNVIIANYTADLRIVGGGVTTNSPIPGEALTTSYSVKNFGSKTAYLQTGLMQCRYNSSIKCDSSEYQNISIAPDETRTFNDTVSTESKSGLYKLIPYFKQDDSWRQYKTEDGASTYPTLYKTIDPYSPSLVIQNNLSMTPSSPNRGSSATLSYTITNQDSRSISVDYHINQCRVNIITNCDAPKIPSFTLAPGETRSVSDTFSFNLSGSYRFIPYFMYDGVWRQYNTVTSSPAIMYQTVN